MDVLFAAYQKLYSALSHLEKFRKSKDLFDNIVAVDGFLTEMRNVTFVLQKSIKHTDYYELYQKMVQKHLSDTHSQWLIEKRNQVTKEYPLHMIKQIVVSVYLPNGDDIAFHKTYTISNEKDYQSTIENIKQQISTINLIEVFFSVYFIYKDSDENYNLFEHISSAVTNIIMFLNDFDQHIDMLPSQERLFILNKIQELNVSALPLDNLFVDDYVFYKQDYIFDRRIGVDFVVNPYVIKYDILAFLAKFNISHSACVLSDMFYCFVQMHRFCYVEQKTIAPTFCIAYSDNQFRLLTYTASIKTTTYRLIHELAKEIADGENILAIFYVGEMLQYNSVDCLKFDYCHRVDNASKELLGFCRIEKNYFRHYFIDKEIATQPLDSDVISFLNHGIILTSSTGCFTAIDKAFRGEYKQENCNIDI